MALMESRMLPLGTPIPAFDLPDVATGARVTPSFAEGKPALIIFLCAHCPYVVHVQEELARLGRDYAGEIALLGISSNDVARYPADAPERLAEMACQLGFEFPVCYDEDQSVARAFDAACTPDFFLFDAELRLVYRGELDPSRPGKGVADGRSLRAAMDALLSGEPIPSEQRPSAGCSIKWK